MVFPMFSKTIISFLSFPLEMEVVFGQTLRSVQHHSQHFSSSLSHPARTCPPWSSLSHRNTAHVCVISQLIDEISLF